MNIDEINQNIENTYRAGNGFSNLDLANAQEPCPTPEQEAAEADMLSRLLNEPTNSGDRELALMDNVSEFVAIYDKYKHDGVGFLNQFTELLEEKLNELI